MEKALEALHVAAQAIRQMPEVANLSVDNDNDSGEILFTINEAEYRLKLEKIHH
jgi:hypothetical protein